MHWEEVKHLFLIEPLFFSSRLSPQGVASGGGRVSQRPLGAPTNRQRHIYLASNASVFKKRVR
jgi:hypothetical protein